MLLQLYFYPTPAKGQGWEIMKCPPCMRAYVCHIFTSTIASHLLVYEDIFTNFVENGRENISVKKNVVLILKTNMAAIADHIFNVKWGGGYHIKKA